MPLRESRSGECGFAGAAGNMNSCCVFSCGFRRVVCGGGCPQGGGYHSFEAAEYCISWKAKVQGAECLAGVRQDQRGHHMAGCDGGRRPWGAGGDLRHGCVPVRHIREEFGHPCVRRVPLFPSGPEGPVCIRRAGKQKIPPGAIRSGRDFLCGIAGPGGRRLLAGAGGFASGRMQGGTRISFPYIFSSSSSPKALQPTVIAPLIWFARSTVTFLLVMTFSMACSMRSAASCQPM